MSGNSLTRMSPNVYWPCRTCWGLFLLVLSHFGNFLLAWGHRTTVSVKPWSLSVYLTLPMLRLLSSKPQGCKDFWKSSKPCHVGIHLKALAEYFQMSIHLPGFQSFSRFLRNFVFVKLVTSSIRVKLFVSHVLYFCIPISLGGYMDTRCHGY